MGYRRNNELSATSGFIILGVIVWLFAAWITHIVVCLKAGSWGFLIAGAIMAPIAWIHGTGVWFGWF